MTKSAFPDTQFMTLEGMCPSFVTDYAAGIKDYDGLMMYPQKVVLTPYNGPDLRAAFLIGDVYKNNVQVIKNNWHTCWVRVAWRKSRYSRPVMRIVKRHKEKHGMVLYVK